MKPLELLLDMAVMCLKIYIIPIGVLMPYIDDYNAIEAIYRALNQNVKAADVTQIIMDLQALVVIV